MPRYRDMEERLLANSVISDTHGLPGSPCWLWIGGRDAQGKYGHINVHVPGKGTRNRMAHRVSFETFVGPVPEGLQLDHRTDLGCAGGLCIHPNHTEPVTNEENTRRRDARYLRAIGVPV